MDTNQNEMPNQLQQKNENIKKPLEVEPLKKLWRTFQLYSEDPLEKFCFEQDYSLSSTSATYDEYWRLAQQQDPKKLTSLLFESWKWRADSRNNCVMSCEGIQGSGKSLGNIEFARILGKIFDRPFSLQDIAFYPEEMEDLISHSQNRQTMMCDEQQITSVGIMSNTIKNRLVDFEEQLRFCCGAETEIMISDGKQIKIKDLANKEFYVISYNFLKKEREIDIAKCRFSGRQRVTRLIFENGRHIDLTENHRLFKKENNKIIEDKVANLKEGDNLFGDC